MEGVEPSWPFDRRLLRPVRIPVPPHPQCVEKRRRAAGSSCRACGSPFTQPVAAAARHVVLSRGAPGGERRAARPWPGAAAPASGVPRPVRGGDASPPPLCLEGRARRPRDQRAPRANSEMSCGVAVSKPTTSSIPVSFGSAIEKPFETMPTTTSAPRCRRRGGRRGAPGPGGRRPPRSRSRCRSRTCRSPACTPARTALAGRSRYRRTAGRTPS